MPRKDKKNDKKDKKISTPDYLNDYGKKKWQELAPIFIERNMLGAADLSAFELLCHHYGVAMELYDAMIKKSVNGELSGYFVDRNSQTMGEYLGYQKALMSYTKMLIEFGLTPAAKKKVPAPETNEIEDDISKMMYDK